MTGTAVDAERWIRQFHPAPDSDTTLVCLPYAGGSASYYFPLSKALASAGVEVRAIQYPGRQDRYREPCIDNIPELADAICAAIVGLTDKPLAIFGHSMGAVLAYEVTLRLERLHGTKPLQLFVSGRRAPSCVREGEEQIHRRDDAGVIREMRTLQGTDAAVLQDEELLQLVLPVLRNDYRAIETYRAAPGAMLNCPVVGLVGDDDPRTTIEEALAWEKHTTGEFDLRIVPGGHFFLHEQLKDVVDAVIGGLRAAKEA